MNFLDADMERRRAELDELDVELKTIEFKACHVPADRQVQFYDDLQALRSCYGSTRRKEFDTGPQNSTNHLDKNAAQAGERVISPGTARPPQASLQPLNGDPTDD